MISIRDLIEKTTSQSEQQREVRQAERTNLSQMRDAAFEVVTTEPELYQKYLTLQADNIRCSAGNVALTLIQLPDANKIGSIDYWHSVGRYVQDEAMQNGAKVFVPPRNKNARGYFMETYNYNEFAAAGLDMTFVQDNQSKSKREARSSLPHWNR